jgi:hypothetical protein
MGDFGLIQAILLRDETDSKRLPGLSNYFRFRNHGMSEFEWGAIPQAIRRMRAALPELRDFELNVHGHRAIAICHPKDETDVAKFFREELRIGRQGRAFLCLRDAYGLSEDTRPPLYNEVAWFSLSSEVPWVVCKTDEVAANWRKALEDQARPVNATMSGHRLELFYTKEDFVRYIGKDTSWKYEGREYLQRIEPSEAPGAQGKLYLTHYDRLVAELVPGWSKDIEFLVNGFVEKCEHPDQVHLWKTVQVEEHTLTHFTLVEEDPRKRR